MKSLPHKFEVPDSKYYIAQIDGYQKCLSNLTSYITQNTDSHNYLLNSNVLLSVINSTKIELRDILFADIKTELNSLTQFTNR